MLNLGNADGDIGILAGSEAFAGRGMMIIAPDNTGMLSGNMSEENYINTSTSTSFVRSFTAGNMSIVYLPFAVNTSGVDGTFYKYGGYDGKNVIFVKVADESTEADIPYLFMPASTGKVVFEGETITGLPADIPESEAGGLYGVYRTKAFTAGEESQRLYYGWAQGGLWHAGEDATVKHNRAYQKTNGGILPRMTVKIGDCATDIDSVTIACDAPDAPAYNLQGQRANDCYNGIVIRNGRKTVAGKH